MIPEQMRDAIGRLRGKQMTIEVCQLDAFMLMQNVLIACRHPEHVGMATHRRMVRLAEKTLRAIAADEPELLSIIEAQLEGVA